MAGEPWNRGNVPFPSAVSSVRIHFNATTDANVKALLRENEMVLKLIRSEILQTEIRVLYELLYILNNSYRGNKTFKALQQVEQCVNRLKNMKLEVVLQELADMCPNRIQRRVSIKVAQCDVPSQPMLEWLSLKVLGAAKLMSCTLSRCNKAFVLSKQQMKWEEFIILNVVITSMLSRLWVIFRGVLVSLSTLYQELLEFHKKVAHAQPMPFLTDFSLPVDLAQFLGTSAVSLPLKQPKNDHKAKQQTKMTSSVKVTNQGQAWKVKEDLGVAIERDIVLDTDMTPFLKVFRNLTEGKSLPQETHKVDKKVKLKKQMKGAATFTDMATLLEEMILWCKSERMEKEKRLLTFLRLKCQKFKSLEASGYNVQKKLQTFRQEVCWASSPEGSVPRTCATAPMRRNANRRTRYQSIRSRFKSSTGKTGLKKKHLKKCVKRRELSVSLCTKDDQSSSSIYEATPQTTDCDGNDDIDDIFAAAGF